MASSIIWYLREFVRGEWIRKFFTVKTAPLVTPPHFRGFPALTDRECTHCLACMMICPAPDAIEVLETDGVWNPVVYPGHCIRCGLCVEACPEDVLTAGELLSIQKEDQSSFASTFHLTIDPVLCSRCGNCAVACPINKEIDPYLGGTGTAFSEEVIMRIINGEMRVINPEKCTGCKTCEKTCANHAIRVARVVVGIQEAAV
ncbi:4Fe-4S binding protein [Methanogenium organophilum]|uniref:4Fe-4S binding protein n=1 Tax=Methanogenium organophilum TaxID=2199 RepID=A0A9X9S432_METOG|nr:4Fe-4S binding protein [Methanogenium organophilum]WAI01125.1 4Fe-4S binding protein [Methanogenium organophilum]